MIANKNKFMFAAELFYLLDRSTCFESGTR
jgi:hypothetical protein